jgi:hypothetical protein
MARRRRRYRVTVLSGWADNPHDASDPAADTPATPTPERERVALTLPDRTVTCGSSVQGVLAPNWRQHSLVVGQFALALADQYACLNAVHSEPGPRS